MLNDTYICIAMQVVYLYPYQYSLYNHRLHSTTVLLQHFATLCIFIPCVPQKGAPPPPRKNKTTLEAKQNKAKHTHTQMKNCDKYGPIYNFSLTYLIAT